MPELRQVADGFPETDQVIGRIDLYAFEFEYQSEAGDFLKPFACLAQGGAVSLGQGGIRLLLFTKIENKG